MAWLQLYLLLLGASPPPTLPATAGADWGPLTVHSLAPVFTSRLAYTSGRIPPLPQGQALLHLGLTEANTWAPATTTFFDGDWARLELRGEIGLGAGLALQLGLSLQRRGGGLWDGMIETFHRLSHLDNADRERYPRGRLRIYTYDHSRNVTFELDGGPAYGLSNPTLGLKWALRDARDGGPHLVLEAVAKLPVGSLRSGFATGHLETLFDLGLQQGLGQRGQLYVVVGLVQGWAPQMLYGMPLSRLQRFILIGLGWRLSNDFLLITHYLNQDGAVADPIYDEFLTYPTHEFVFGLRWIPSQASRWHFELGCIENAVNMSNTADFGLHLAIQLHLGGAPSGGA